MADDRRHHADCPVEEDDEVCTCDSQLLPHDPLPEVCPEEPSEWVDLGGEG